MSKARTIKLSEARSTFSSLINDVFRTRGRVLIEKSGIPVAAVVSLDDLERLERLDTERAARNATLETYASNFDEYSSEQIEIEVAKAIAEVRSDRRARVSTK
jgi:prevent-host-death family protein